MRLIFSAGLLVILVVSDALAKKPDQDTRMTRTIERSFKVPDKVNVEIINKYGPVIVNTWENDSVKVTIELTAFGNKRSTISKTLDRVDFDFNLNNEFLTIETILDRKSGFFQELWNSINDYSQTLLSKNKLRIAYDVFIPENAQLDLDNKFGDVYIAELEEKSKIVVSHGNLRAKSFGDYSRIDVSFGNATIKSVNEGLLNFKAADVEIQQIRNCEIRSSSSQVSLVNAYRVKMDSRSDRRYRIENIDHLSGKGYFSRLYIRNVKSSLNLDLNFGEVTVTAVNGDFNSVEINGKSTDIDLTFDTQSHINVDVHARDQDLDFDLPIANIKRRYTDDKDKYISLKGSVGPESEKESTLIIDSTSGEVSVQSRTVKNEGS